AALVLRFGHLVDTIQLANEALLIGLRKTPEAWVVLQHPLLRQRRSVAVLVEPCAEMPRRRISWLRSSAWIIRAISLALISGQSRPYVHSRAGWRLGAKAILRDLPPILRILRILRSAIRLVCLGRPAIVLRPLTRILRPLLRRPGRLAVVRLRGWRGVM